MQLLVTRPEPDGSRQAKALADLGHSVLLEPLLEISFEADGALDFDGVQGLIATSRNGLRALETAAGPVPEDMPLYAVGEASACKARELGFKTVHEGPGDGAGLAALVCDKATPGEGALLHLAGEHLASDLKGRLEMAGFDVRQPVLYRARARAGLSAPVCAALSSGGIEGVILMSPRSAKIYQSLLDQSDLTKAAQCAVHFCLSEAVAAQLTPALVQSVRTSVRPREDDLFVLIAREAAE